MVDSSVLLTTDLIYFIICVPFSIKKNFKTLVSS